VWASKAQGEPRTGHHLSLIDLRDGQTEMACNLPIFASLRRSTEVVLAVAMAELLQQID